MTLHEFLNDLKEKEVEAETRENIRSQILGYLERDAFSGGQIGKLRMNMICDVLQKLLEEDFDPSLYLLTTMLGT
ncbi:hypothetical protein GWN49_04870 [Candidatus Bathyarchaeota archaeon]|nr:hypothetical protein [Candidatus Bathyarchaeota archaeon]